MTDNPGIIFTLGFDVPGRSLHCPMVAAAIGGCTTRLIVDTGATTHLLTTEFAKRAGLRLEQAEPGRDVAGDAVPSWSTGNVAVEIDNAGLVLTDVIAIDGPEPFEGWGVGGFLSPQALGDQATVVLDLAMNHLNIVSRDSSEVATDVSSGVVNPTVVEGVRHAAGTIGTQLRVPHASPVVAIFDTGAARTEIAERALPERVDGNPRSDGGKSVGGSGIEVAHLADQELEIGPVRLRLDDLAVRDAIPAPDDAAASEEPHALIGMDLLVGTVLVIAPREDGRVWWIVPYDPT